METHPGVWETFPRIPALGRRREHRRGAGGSGWQTDFPMCEKKGGSNLNVVASVWWDSVQPLNTFRSAWEMTRENTHCISDMKQCDLRGSRVQHYIIITEHSPIPCQLCSETKLPNAKWGIAVNVVKIPFQKMSLWWEKWGSVKVICRKPGEYAGSVQFLASCNMRNQHPKYYIAWWYSPRF